MTDAPNSGPRPFDTTLARWASAFVSLFGVSFVRLARSRQTIICIMLLVFVSIPIYAWSSRRERTADEFIEEIFLVLFISFLLPVFTLAFGAAGIASDRDERTLVYLLVSPLPRPLVFFAKALASLALSLSWTVGGLTIMCLLSGEPGRTAWPVLVPGIFWATVAYVMLFLLLSVLFKHATIIALGYALFVETMLGNMPGIVKRLAISFYVKCVCFDAGAELGVSPSGQSDAALFAPISGESALTALYVASAGCALLGALIFARREYATN